jgi:hypothetical protein
LDQSFFSTKIFEQNIFPTKNWLSTFFSYLKFVFGSRISQNTVILSYIFQSATILGRVFVFFTVCWIIEKSVVEQISGEGNSSQFKHCGVTGKRISLRSWGIVPNRDWAVVTAARTLYNYTECFKKNVALGKDDWCLFRVWWSYEHR